MYIQHTMTSSTHEYIALARFQNGYLDRYAHVLCNRILLTFFLIAPLIFINYLHSRQLAI